MIEIISSVSMVFLGVMFGFIGGMVFSIKLIQYQLKKRHHIARFLKEQGLTWKEIEEYEGS